jgi:hypothetical protein
MKSRHGLRPALRFRGLRYERTADSAFRTPAYAAGWEPHIAPNWWQRVRLFLKRNFS